MSVIMILLYMLSVHTSAPDCNRNSSTSLWPLLLATFQPSCSVTTLPMHAYVSANKATGARLTNQLPAYTDVLSNFYLKDENELCSTSRRTDRTCLFVPCARTTAYKSSFFQVNLTLKVRLSSFLYFFNHHIEALFL